MPKFKVQKTSSMKPKDSFDKIKQFLSADPDLKMLDSSYKCQFEDEKMTGSAKGQKFNAQMQVTPDGDESKIEITVDLPLLLMPFKGMVENTLNKKLDKLLG
jgi:hypothetical protein